MAGRVVFAVCFVFLVPLVAGLGSCTQRVWFDAVRSSSLSTLTACMDEGFPIETRDELGCPAIVNGAANQHFSVLEFLVNNGADVNGQCHSGSTALQYVAKNNNLHLAKYLLRHGAGPSRKGALTTAVRAGHIEMIKFLLGMDVDLLESWSGNELLWAAANNQDEELRHMYARGLGVESTDAHGHTPLILAARYGATVSLRVLLQLGANIEARCHGGLTAIAHAAYHGHAAAVQALLEAGATLESIDDSGWTPVIWAAVQGHTELLLQLIGAHAEYKTVRAGWTALQAATAANQGGAVQLLLRNGADWKTPNEAGLTCEAIAKAKGHTDLARLFHGMRETVEYEVRRQGGALPRGHSEL